MSRLKYRRELEAINPEKKESESGDGDGNRDALRIEKHVIEDDVYDHRAQESQAKRNEARAEEQTQAAQNLQDRDHIHVAAAHQGGHESAGLAMHFGNRHEFQESIRPEDDENEAEKNTGDDDDIFHKDGLVISANLLEKEWLTAPRPNLTFAKRRPRHYCC